MSRKMKSATLPRYTATITAIKSNHVIVYNALDGFYSEFCNLLTVLFELNDFSAQDALLLFTTTSCAHSKLRSFVRHVTTFLFCLFTFGFNN